MMKPLELRADPDNPITAVYPLSTRTPASDYALGGYGSARLIRAVKPKGVYWLSDVSAFQFLKVIEPVPVTHLQTREGDDWQTWMVDDPEHWVMLHEYAKRIKGPRVCIAGLGLCLIAHILANRQDIREVVIVDRNRDVIELMTDRLPPSHQRRHVHQADFWTFIEQCEPNSFNTFFVDLWRGPIVHLMHDVLERRQFLESLHPWPRSESLFFWFQSAIDRARREEFNHGGSSVVRPVQ
jgi:hypothetical protein